jgi:hypothetical protein
VTAAFENALRLEASEWAQGAGLVFVWDNAAPRDPHAAKTLDWQFEPGQPEQLTSLQVRHRCSVNASIYVPAGSGMVAALQLAESLRQAMAGLRVAGGEVLAEVEIGAARRDGPSCVIDVRLPCLLDVRRVPLGAFGAQLQASALTAYQAFRARWESRIRAPLNLPTYWDDSPPASPTPPWAWASWRTLEPVPLEIGSLRVPGRVIVAMNHALGSGVQAANSAASAIEASFHQCTFGGLVFGTSVVTRPGRTLIDTWQTNVRLPFHYDQRI